MKEEEWRPVVGYEEDYEVSDTGKVRSLDRMRYITNRFGKQMRHPIKGKEKKLIETWDGYLEVHLQHVVDGKSKNYYPRVHRLVAEAFILNPDNKPQVNHKDGNKKNNCVDNLEWVTESENVQHAIRKLHGIWQHQHGTCADVKVKCLTTGQWFDREIDAVRAIGGDAAAFNVALLSHRPYKGYVFETEAFLNSLTISEEDYLKQQLANYRGPGWSFRYEITCSDGNVFASQAKFCKHYNLTETQGQKLFKDSDTAQLGEVTVTRRKIVKETSSGK